MNTDFNNSLMIFIMPTLRGHTTFYKHVKVFISGQKEDDTDIRHILILRAWDIHKGAIDDHFKSPGNTCEKKYVKGREELEKDFEPFEKFMENAEVKYQILDLIEKVENKNECIQKQNEKLLNDNNVFKYDLGRIYEKIKEIKNNYNIKKIIFSATTGYGVYRVAILPYIKEKEKEKEELKKIDFEIIHLNQDGKFKIVESNWNSKTEEINIFNKTDRDREVLEDYLFKINNENIIYKSEYSNLISILKNRYKYSNNKEEAIKQYNENTKSTITEEKLKSMKQEYKNTFRKEDCFDNLINEVLTEDSTLRAFFRGKPEETALHQCFETFFKELKGCNLDFFIENKILVKDNVLKLIKERSTELQELNVSINKLFTKNESNNTEILDNLEKSKKELEKELKEKIEKLKKIKKHLIKIDDDYIFNKDLLFEELVAQMITREVENVNNKIYQYRNLEIKNKKDKKKEIEVDLALFSTKIKFLNIEVKIGVPKKKRLRANIAYSRNIFDGDFILVLPLLKNEFSVLKKDIDTIVDMKGLRIYGLDEIKNVISRL